MIKWTTMKSKQVVDYNYKTAIGIFLKENIQKFISLHYNISFQSSNNSSVHSAVHMK